MWFTMGRRKKLSDAYSYINRPHKLYLQHPAIQNISFNCIDRLYQENTFHPLLRIKAVNTPGLILQIWAKVSYDFTTQDFSKRYDLWLASLHLTMIENGHKLASF